MATQGWGQEGDRAGLLTIGYRVSFGVIKCSKMNCGNGYTIL